MFSQVPGAIALLSILKEELLPPAASSAPYCGHIPGGQVIPFRHLFFFTTRALNSEGTQLQCVILPAPGRNKIPLSWDTISPILELKGNLELKQWFMVGMACKGRISPKT